MDLGKFDLPHAVHRDYPHHDRKSSEVIDNDEINVRPLRKRVRKFLKLRGLERCDRRERTCLVQRA